MKNKFIFLYDGGCPLCLRDTNFLKNKDVLNRINFVDINANDYNPANFKNISYEEAMSNLDSSLATAEGQNYLQRANKFRKVMSRSLVYLVKSWEK